MMRRNQPLYTDTGRISRRRGIPRLAIGIAFAVILLVGSACGSPPSTTETTPAPQEPPPGQPADVETQPPAEPEPTEPPPAAPVETESPYAEGSVVRASYDPAAGWGAPDVHEDFEGSSGLFADVTAGAATSFYDMGSFHITFTSRGWWTWYFGDVGLPSSFYADVVITNGDQCVDRDSAGMLVRGHEGADFGYLFGITCKGGYYVAVSAGPGTGGPVCMFLGSAFIPDPSVVDCSGLPLHNMSDYIQAGPGAVNRLGVRGNGTYYELYVNGHRVGSLQDNVTPWAAGYPALFLGTGQKDLSEVSFDDFSLWRDP